MKKLNRIKIVLTITGVKGKDVAAHLGHTESTVSMWCTNKIQPSIETLFKIAEFVKVDVRELINSKP